MFLRSSERTGQYPCGIEEVEMFELAAIQFLVELGLDQIDNEILAEALLAEGLI